MIDDDPATEARRTAVQFVNDGKATLAQVWATLDLADATREQTAALEAISAGWRLGR